METPVEAVTANRLRSRCCACGHPLSLGRSIAMEFGVNSGHVTCPACHEFLHVEQLEGDEAATEKWDEYIDRQYGGGFPL